MVRTRAHRNSARQATSPAPRCARALAAVLFLAALVLAPFATGAGAARSTAEAQVAQLVSDPGKASKGCPKKGLPGQIGTCAASAVPIAAPPDRGLALAPVAEGSSLAPPYEVALATQCCGAPPDRPPRFAA